jgi:ketosteroid isomerase-like protein
VAAEVEEKVRRLYRAMDSFDVETAESLLDPDAEWTPDPRTGQGPVRGRDQVVRFFTDLSEMFGSITTEIEGLWEREGQVLVFLHMTGRGGISGAGFDIRIAHLLTFEGGVVVRGRGFGDRDEARRAARLDD